MASRYMTVVLIQWACVLPRSEDIHICDLARPSCRREGSLCLQRFANALSPSVFAALKSNTSASGNVDGWLLRTSHAGNVFEEAAFAAADLLGLGAEDWESVEYWNHDWSRYNEAPWNNYHFDILEPNMCYAHPFLSSVMYFDDTGPPTVILSKTLSDVPFASPESGPSNSSVFLSWPEVNHLTAWSGDLAHGVLWRAQEQSNVQKQPSELRNVLLFAFWKHALIPPEAFNRRTRKADAPALGIISQGAPQAQDRGASVYSKEVLPYRLSAQSARHSVVAYVEDPMDMVKVEVEFSVVGAGDSVEGCKLNRRTWQRECASDYIDFPLLEVQASIRRVTTLQPPKFTGGIYDQPQDSMFGPGIFTITVNTTVDNGAAALAIEGRKVADLSVGESVKVLEVLHIPAIKMVRARIESPPGWFSLLSTSDGAAFAVKQVKLEL